MLLMRSKMQTIYLKVVLEANLPRGGLSRGGLNPKSKITLGVADKNLAGSIKETFSGYEYKTGDLDEVVADLLRGLRQHAPKLLRQLGEGDYERSQLGMGHAYSRAKIKFNIYRNDNHVIQAIASLDFLDKSVNQLAMRARDWYGWHFPELVKFISSNKEYAKCAFFIRDRKSLGQDKLHDLAELVNNDGDVAQAIIDAAIVSMGRDVTEEDMENIMLSSQTCNYARRLPQGSK